MRRIRFKPDLIDKIRAGQKTMTFRVTRRPPGDYIVEEGGHSYFKHIDTGLRIRIVDNFVAGTVEYVDKYYREEGFDDVTSFARYLRVLYKGKEPEVGFGHRFVVLKGEG